MKKFVPFFILNVCFVLNLYSLDVNVDVPGTFASTIGNGLETVTELKVTGTIDARDFKTMRDEMIALETIDLSQVTVVAFTGAGGTLDNSSTYNENELPDRAFYFKLGSATITQIVLPNSIEVIGERGLYYCNNVASFTIPDNVKEIKTDAFGNCFGLTTVVLPASLETIGNTIFNNCTKLSSINITADNQFFMTDDNVLFNKNKTNLICYAAAKTATSYKIPESVTAISERAFNGASKLTRIIMPPLLEKIATRAFQNCSKLSTLYIPYSVTTIESGAFHNCTGITTIIVDQTEPLNIPAGLFERIDKTNCALCVPASAVNDYTTSENTEWQGFDLYIPITNLFGVASPVDMQPEGGEKNVAISMERVLNDLEIVCDISKDDNADWLDAVIDNNVITLTAEKNEDDTRIATITVSAFSANNVRTFQVSQAKYEPSGLGGKLSSTLNAVVQDNYLVVSGLIIGNQLQIIDFSGKMIYNQPVRNSREFILLPAKGLYLVKTGTDTLKTVY